MSVEQAIYNALRGLVANRVYPDVAPESATRPYLTYQQVGGQAVNFLDPTAPSMSNGRFRVNVWADTRAGAAALAGMVEATLRDTPALQTTVLTAPMAMADAETKLRGTSQDFSFWFAP